MNSTRVPPARQDPDDLLPHHMRARDDLTSGAKLGHTFNALFTDIAARTDISAPSKLVHARLVSMNRMGKAWTQTEIGMGVGLSRHQVWRALGELVRAGLVRVIRHGQGLPSSYVLLGLADGAPGSRATGRPDHRRQDAGRPGTPPGATFFTGKKTGRSGYIPARTAPSDYTGGALGRYIRT